MWLTPHSSSNLERAIRDILRHAGKRGVAEQCLRALVAGAAEGPARNGLRAEPQMSPW